MPSNRPHTILDQLAADRTYDRINWYSKTQEAAKELIDLIGQDRYEEWVHTFYEDLVRMSWEALSTKIRVKIAIERAAKHNLSLAETLLKKEMGT